MKKSIIALVLALTLAGTLASCGTDRDPGGNNTGSTTGSGTGSGSTAGQVSRRYDNPIYNGRSYMDDGRYTAGANGRVYDSSGGTVSRDLTQGARDIVRDTGDKMEDLGRGIGDAARDITGTYSSGTPSWEPDSSAARY